MSEENKRIYLASPHMGGLEEVFVKEAFDTNWIAPLGANVDGFEKELSEYVGSKTGAALASGTAAIHMALKAVGVKKGDKVFCSSLTFAASCNPIIYEGGIPVFIDSEPESHNMSPIALEKAFKAYEEKGEMPKAVIVVNLYGQSADMDKIMEICKKYNVPIIEDAAESLGATYKGKHSGTFGEYGIYSFNGNKIITTSGGGMLVSNNEEGIAKVRFWSTQARDKARHYEHTELGYNYRMSNIVAGIGRGQLRVLEDRIAKKKEIFETYKEAFKDIEDIEMMPVCEYGEPNYWLTTITLNENSKVKPLDIILALEKENIESRPIWKPMHIQPYYKEYDFYSHNEDEISVSEDIFNRGVCLPSDTKMTKEEQERIIKIIKELF
ncbi:spore coat polysaccharide biosynthesis protein [Clostridium perfringens]|nr:spore coat polysaccharide biosynthesis protein [Clostridium perfringens]